MVLVLLLLTVFFGSERSFFMVLTLLFFNFERSFIMSLRFGPKTLLLVFLLTLFGATLVVLPFEAIRFSTFFSFILISLFFNSNNLLFKPLLNPKILYNDLFILPIFEILIIRQKSFVFIIK